MWKRTVSGHHGKAVGKAKKAWWSAEYKKLCHADSNPAVEKQKEKIQIPIWEKANLTIQEAAVYFNIGEKKLREMSNNPKCKFALFVGNKCLIKRKSLEEYLKHTSYI